MIGLFLAIVIAAVAYAICLAAGLPFVVALLAAVLILLVGADRATGGRYR